MTEISQELRQLLDGIVSQLEENGVIDFILITSYKDEDVISTKMTPQKTLLWLINSLETTKEQCLRQTSGAEKQTNN